MSANSLPYKEQRFRRHLEGPYAPKKEVDLFILGCKRDGCMICAEKNPVCLEFHHRDRNTKEFTIAQARQSHIALSRIEAEISKCDLLCRNCLAKEEFNLRGVGAIPKNLERAVAPPSPCGAIPTTPLQL